MASFRLLALNLRPTQIYFLWCDFCTESRLLVSLASELYNAIAFVHPLLLNLSNCLGELSFGSQINAFPAKKLSFLLVKRAVYGYRFPQLYIGISTTASRLVSAANMSSRRIDNDLGWIFIGWFIIRINLCCSGKHYHKQRVYLLMISFSDMRLKTFALLWRLLLKSYPHKFSLLPKIQMHCVLILVKRIYLNECE